MEERGCGLQTEQGQPRRSGKEAELQCRDREPEGDPCPQHARRNRLAEVASHAAPKLLRTEGKAQDAELSGWRSHRPVQGEELVRLRWTLNAAAGPEGSTGRSRGSGRGRGPAGAWHAPWGADHIAAGARQGTRTDSTGDARPSCPPPALLAITGRTGCAGSTRRERPASLPRFGGPDTCRAACAPHAPSATPQRGADAKPARTDVREDAHGLSLQQ